MTKASRASTSVIQRCFQIVPSTNHLTIRRATSDGVEKKKSLVVKPGIYRALFLLNALFPNLVASQLRRLAKRTRKQN